jgi:hypothetical protein
VRFVRIPRDVMDKKAVEQGDIRFFELAALSVDVRKNKRDVMLTLTDFVIPLDDVPQDVQKAITHWSQWIDYWAMDWDNKVNASPLERLLIEQVSLCWLHLYTLEIEYTNVMHEPIPLASAEHWERRLSAAQRRYLAACDALARVRRLATPAEGSAAALQVNIAAPGGQQVNLLGPQPPLEG